VNEIKLDTLSWGEDPTYPRPLWVGREKQLRNQTTQLPLGRIAMFGPEKNGIDFGNRWMSAEEPWKQDIVSFVTQLLVSHSTNTNG
jgi:hypothetical protein